jgi:hypothetical protein
MYLFILPTGKEISPIPKRIYSLYFIGILEKGKRK